jgi:hypothetical protein
MVLQAFSRRYLSDTEGLTIFSADKPPVDEVEIERHLEGVPGQLPRTAHERYFSSTDDLLKNPGSFPVWTLAKPDEGQPLIAKF